MRSRETRPRLQPRPPRRSGSAAGPLVFLAGVLALLFLGVVVVRPLIVDSFAADAFAEFAKDKDSLLRQAQVRALLIARVGNDADRARDAGGAARPFVVKRGETARDVAVRLEREGLVRNALWVTLVLYDEGRADSLQAGTYSVSPAMTSREITRLLDRAPGEQTLLRIIEGWRVSEIAAAVAKAFPGVSASAFTAAAVVGERKDPLLAGLDPTTSLEGFLYPDSYFFRPSASAQEIVDGLFATFRERVGPALLAARERGLRVYDVVRLASIVEREAQDRGESAVIAGVYANRLRIGMSLDADPTIQYALGDWRVLALRDLQIASPYNTYRVGGLPPTPICSPGRTALEAAAAPAEHPYLFFVAKSDGTGGHAFSRTLDEHEANRVKYGNR